MIPLSIIKGAISILGSDGMVRLAPYPLFRIVYTGFHQELIGICISSGCELGGSLSYDMDIRPFGEHLHGKSRSAAGGAKLVKCVSWVRDTRGVSIRVGRLVDGDLGGLGRSSRSSFALEMIQDASDDRRLRNEGDDFHLFSASTTGQRVDLVDTVDELGPSLTQSTSSRENIVLFFLLLFHGVTASDLF